MDRLVTYSKREGSQLFLNGKNYVCTFHPDFWVKFSSYNETIN